MRPPGPPQQQQPQFPQGAGQPGQYPPGQSPYHRQQQLAAMANAQQMMQQSNAGGGIDPRQYQQQMLAQQQAAMAFQAAQGGAGGMGGGMMGGMPSMGGPQNPGGVNPAAYNQLAQYQAAQAQQQQQQAHLAAQQQQQQHQAALMAAQQKARAAAAARPKPSLPPQAVPVPPPNAAHDEDHSPNADILDVLTARQLAIHRFAKNHELFTSIVDPWKVMDVLAGKKRLREIEDQVKAGRSVTSGGIAGLGKTTELSELACQAIRFPEGTGTKAGPAADAEPPKKMSLEDRKKRLLELQAEADREVEELKKRFEEQTAASRERQQAVVQA